MKCKVTDIYNQPNTGFFVEVTGEDAKPTTALFGPFVDEDETLIALVELGGLYDLDVPYMPALEGVDFQSIFVGAKFSMNDPNEVTCGYLDGDTGALAFGHGRSPALALADLAASHGFRSKLPDDARMVTLGKWLVDFAYGFNRASEDQLMLEMEAITTPTKGTW